MIASERAEGQTRARGSRLARSLSAAGAILAALALAPQLLDLTTSRLGFAGAALLIVGCDLLVAALVLHTRRDPSASSPRGGVTLSLSAGAANGVVLFVTASASLIALLGQSKPVERLDYFLAILVLVPLSATLAWRRAREGPGQGEIAPLDLAAIAATAIALCLARLLFTEGAAGVTLFLALSLLVVRACLALAARAAPRFRTNAIPGAVGIPLLLAIAVVPFIPAATLSALDIAVALAAAGAAFMLVSRRWSRVSRGWTLALDLAVLAACTLVVVHVGAPYFELAANQNYFLSPASDVLHGRPMLVGTFSQYGVGIMDALAGVFLVLPIGYGAFTLLLSALTALLFAVFYVVLRWSTESLPIAVAGLTVAVVLYVFGQEAFYTTFPSTGVLRFGAPWLVILCSLTSARFQRRRRLCDALTLAIIALAAVWSAETGAYCIGTAGALACLDAAVTQEVASVRLRMAAQRIGLLVVSALQGVLTFTVLTRIATGVWAHWGSYLEYIRLYTVNGFNVLPIERWSAGLALGGMYVLSAVAVASLVATRPEIVRSHILAFRAAAGLTALGALDYTYFLGRAAANNLIHVSPPAVVLLFVWLGIARATFSSRVSLALVSATVAFFGALIIASESEDVSQKYPSTALAALAGGAPPLGGQIEALWRNPIVDPISAHALELISSLRASHADLAVLLTPDVETEVLLRLHVANAVGSSNPCQESISSKGPPRIAAAVRALRPGDVVVTSTSELDGGILAPLQRYAIDLLQDRFKLRQIASDGAGMQALRIVGRSSGPVKPVTVPPSQIVPRGCA